MYEQPTTKKRPRYYRDTDNNIFRSLCTGFHICTGEQLVALRKIADGTVWMIPKQELYKTVLIGGVPIKSYIEDFEYEEPAYTPTSPPKSPKTYVEYPLHDEDSEERPGFKDTSPHYRHINR